VEPAPRQGQQCPRDHPSHQALALLLVHDEARDQEEEGCAAAGALLRAQERPAAPGAVAREEQVIEGRERGVLEVCLGVVAVHALRQVGHHELLRHSSNVSTREQHELETVAPGQDGQIVCD